MMTTAEDEHPHERETIPERFLDDGLVQYFRSRYSTREALMSTFDKHETDRIQSELLRIERLREHFRISKNHESEMDDLGSSLAKWKQAAATEAEKTVKILTHDIKKLQHEIQKNEGCNSNKNTLAEDVSKLGTKTKLLNTHKSLILKLIPNQNQEPEEPRQRPLSSPPTPAIDSKVDSDFGFTVSTVTLEKDSPSGTYTKFSMEKFALNMVIHGGNPDERDPLREKPKPNSLRSKFVISDQSIPNLLSSEQKAITRYHEEERGEYNYRKSHRYRRKSSNFLNRQYWDARQHGSLIDPVHARHMRPHCSLVSPDHSVVNTAGQNRFIIFMPYLHWETDKRRSQMATITREITYEHQRKNSANKERVANKFRNTVNQAPQYQRQATSFSAQDTKKNPSELKLALGKYLKYAAKVYDAMDTEHDVLLLKYYLHHEPPLHGRRTLDQSYYWKIDDTGPRDRDQVVYRATKTGEDTKKTSRVVMVDQLWLYILDDHTIISSFPRRWGRNKPDHSGVHNSIRSKLKHLHEGDITSVYDLALIIVNQCSTVFFDRTKLVDERPEVFDIFANAIGNISGLKTDAFEQFWWYLRTLHLTDPQQTEFQEKARKYLNIDPEGELLREAHDIVDELKMMQRIYEQQLSAIKDFSKHLQDIYDEQHPPPSNDRLLEGLKRLLPLSSNFSGSPVSPGFHNDEVSQYRGLQNGISTQCRLPQESLSSTRENTNGYHHYSESTLTENKAAEAIAVYGVIPKSTVNRAKALIENIAMRREDLQDLQNTTKDISDQLHTLLSLKQQQASVVEAEASLRLSHESVIQGRSIMLFTVVTIIFLPLSFMSSLFGMNASELSGPDQAPLSLVHEFKFMFPISLGIIIPTLGLAFSARIRRPILTFLDWLGKLLHLMWTNVTALVLDYSKIHYYWRYCLAHSKLLKSMYKLGKDCKENYGVKGLRAARKSKNAKIKRLREVIEGASEAKLKRWLDDVRNDEIKKKNKDKKKGVEKRERERSGRLRRFVNDEAV